MYADLKTKKRRVCQNPLVYSSANKQYNDSVGDREVVTDKGVSTAYQTNSLND